MERRVKEGSINAETYCWKEGMDGWEQVPLIAELKDLLTKKPEPLVAAPPSMPAPAKAQAPAPVKPAAPAATAAALLATPSPAAPVASAPLIKEAPAPAGWAGAMEGLEDEAAPAAAAAPPGQEAPVPDLLDIGSAAGERSTVTDSIVMELRKTRKNAYAMPFAVLAAVVFGVTIGFVLFGDQETKIVKQIVEVPAKVGEAIEVKRQAKDLAESEEASGAAAAGEKVAAANVGSKSAGTKSSGSSKGGAAKPANVKGLQGLQGLDGLGGPSGGPAGPSGVASSGKPLSSSQIQSTVSKYRTSVKRGCWERALMSRDKNAPSSARRPEAIRRVTPGSRVASPAACAAGSSRAAVAPRRSTCLSYSRLSDCRGVGTPLILRGRAAPDLPPPTS
jgi:hypothetical protein